MQLFWKPAHQNLPTVAATPSHGRQSLPRKHIIVGRVKVGKSQVLRASSTRTSHRCHPSCICAMGTGRFALGGVAAEDDDGCRPWQCPDRRWHYQSRDNRALWDQTTGLKSLVMPWTGHRESGLMVLKYGQGTAQIRVQGLSVTPIVTKKAMNREYMHSTAPVFGGLCSQNVLIFRWWKKKSLFIKIHF